MCGIAGIFDPGARAHTIRPLLQRMADVMTHRGPDAEGFFAADGIGLGMRRLSIIDVAGGQQPIANEDGAVQVVLNGEIYNHLALRRELIGRGHVFRTKSDTESIAHLYEERGVGAFTELRGMFAIAIWDRRTRRVILARDRLGKKPLFYARRGASLLFGSEIKALLAADATLAEPDEGALVPYLQFGFVPEPRTMFRDIRKLPAAHWLVAEAGRTTVMPYWRLTFDPDPPPRRAVDAVEELDALLEESVRIRLMSEVPLGIFLSGGLDSSTIVAYAHKAGLRPLKTFTIGFDQRQWDESADAAVVARHFATDHHVLTLRERDLTRSLPDGVATLVRHFDEPFGDSSALPTYWVSKLARQHVTVILSGDGGDELFAGYTSYQGIRFAQMYRRVPRWLGRQYLPRIVQAGARWLPPGSRYAALRAARVLHDSELPFARMYFVKGARCGPELLPRLFTADAAARLLGPDLSAFLPEDIGAIMRSDLPDLSKASYVDLRLALLDDMLVKVDRMSMAHSLEVRSPLLDHCLVEYVARLPPSMKLRGWQTKAILRDTVRGYLPAATLQKRKQGFAVPLREWLRDDLGEMVGDLLESAGGRLPLDTFDGATVRGLTRQHRLGQADHSAVLWVLLNYAVWRDLYVHGPQNLALTRPAV